MWHRLSKLKSGVSKLSSWIMSKRLKVDHNSRNGFDESESSRPLSTPTTNMNDVITDEGTSNTSIIYLKPPKKSESDIKEYAVVKLPNGLTVLLISDKSQLLNIDELSGNSESDSAGSGSESSFESEDEGKSMTNDEEMLENKSEEKLAACALCIGVGSFSDPENIPGLAHFLEHMIFMGSEKYPKENEFDVYIKKKGGSDNASTECEYTTFYFDCHETHLFGAMDIFAQLFVSPLMKRESMTKEREAIESEFQMNLPSDGSRKSQLLCGLADNSNPAHKFLWGNLITLRDKVKDDELYEAVHEFRKRHYSAHRMTLAVQARLPLEKLENWVVECFKEVPNNELPQDRFILTVPPFKEKEFSRLLVVEPVKDINHLDLTWVLPSTLKMYRSKPLNHLSWVIGHEGKGSILSYLRKKLWGFDIIVSGGGDGTEENSIYSLFTITLVLTQEGVQHVQEILNSVFQYIKMFQKEGPQKRLFQEMQLIAETSFRFSEEVTSSDNVEQLSENMHFYPSTDYITGMELFFEYDPDLIKSLLSNLRADNVNVMISSKVLAPTENLDKIEPWFGTKYNSKEIPTEWIKEWQDESLQSQYGFHLPEPNPFIPSDFAILPVPDISEEFPKNILKDDIIEVWYKQDVIFKLPNAFCCFHLISPMSYKTAQNAAMLDLFISILKQYLGEDLYPANVAQLEYGFYPGENGMVITVNGYNEKLKLLLRAVIDGIVSLSTDLKPDMVVAMKDEQKRGYANACSKTGFLSRDIRMSILLDRHWTAIQKEEALNDISCESLKSFILQYLGSLFIQCLIQGNISKEEAIELSLIVKNGLPCEPISYENIPEIRVHQLPNGEKYCVVQSFNVNDPNSIVTNYYQSGLGSIQESCVIEMLLMLMEEPLFDSLRTKQQLGYDVSCSLRETFGILGFSVSVHCQSDRNSAESVEKRITEFLRDFVQTLKKISHDDFEEVQESLIKLKKCADIHLKQEVKRNWDEIKGKEYVFDRHHKERKFIEQLSLEEVIQWFELIVGFQSPLKLRKLSTQVVGNLTIGTSGNENLDSKCVQNKLSTNSVKQLKFLSQQETVDKFIFSVKDFKDTLTLYPTHKIV